MAGHGAPLISFSSVDTSLSSLKQCQNYIDTGMEIATSVALDLLQSGCDTVDVDSMETVMLEYASVNRDLVNYISAVEETIGKLKQNPPETVPDIRELVNQKYEVLQGTNTEEALRKNKKFLHFKEQLRDLKLQMGVSAENAEDNFEDEDEEIAVTQSIANFSCPITQAEMVHPVKNKVCGHTYEKEAVEKMIVLNREKGKHLRCPKIGCENIVKSADLIPDASLKRAIEVHRKKQTH